MGCQSDRNIIYVRWCPTVGHRTRAQSLGVDTFLCVCTCVCVSVFAFGSKEFLSARVRQPNANSIVFARLYWYNPRSRDS